MSPALRRNKPSNAPAPRDAILRHGTTTFVRECVGSVLALGITLLLARILGPAQQGRYAVALLIPTTLMTVIPLGWGTATTFYVSRAELSMGQALRRGLALTGIFTVVAAVLAWGAAVHAALLGLDSISVPLIVTAAAAFPALMLLQVCLAIAQGSESFDVFNGLHLLPKLLHLAGLWLALVVLEGGAQHALLSFLAAHGLTTLAGVAWVSWRARPPATRDHAGRNATGGRPPVQLTAMLRYGSTAHVAQILSFINYRVDVLLLNAFLAPHAVGVYVVATAVGERLWLLSQAIAAVLYPHLSRRRKEHGAAEFQSQCPAPNTDQTHAQGDKTSQATRAVWWLSLAAASLLAILAPWLLELVFGPHYRSGATALRLLLPGVVLLAVSRILATDIAARGRPDINAWLAALGAVVNVAANLLLIPRWGIAGAATAASISYGTTAVAKAVAYRQLTGKSVLQLIWPRLNPSDQRRPRRMPLGRSAWPGGSGKNENSDPKAPQHES